MGKLYYVTADASIGRWDITIHFQDFEGKGEEDRILPNIAEDQQLMKVFEQRGEF
jgi:hypothetical protein